MIDSFIPTELAVAPNPLGLAPHLRLTTIPIDASTCFELWMPITNSALLPEEAMLLKGDRSRLEEICARLTWFLGAQFIGCEAAACQSLIYDWREVQRLLRQSDIRFNVLGVTYVPQKIYPDERMRAWTFRPASWKVSLLDLKSIATGFEIEILPMSLSISLGQSVIRYEQGVAIAAD
jgi:hypothetical protein